ncbi:glycosyltransferase family 9 protein [Dysgonomonas reticulitermitis]
MKILIIRFRQIGDTVLTLSLCSSLRNSFGDAEIHLVLNRSIAPLFENHPSIDKIITFDKKENSNFSYVKKVWKTVHENQYDIIIDMRSTLKTSLFSLFSLQSPYRIGRKKWYTSFFHKQRIDHETKYNDLDMIGRNLLLLSPLKKEYRRNDNRDFQLSISEHELDTMKQYLAENGIDFSRPIILAVVASKLSHKMWDINRMAEVIQRILDAYDVQIILNYIPGHEEQIARTLYEDLNQNPHIFIDVQANSLRELAAMSSFCTFFFGNESGNRHIAHAMGVPSFCIVSPNVEKELWLPQNSIEAKGLGVNDICLTSEQKNLTYQQRYDLITVDAVWKELAPMLEKYLKV